MIEPSLIVQIAFDARDSDAVEAPQRALHEVLDLLLQLAPYSIMATLLLAGDKTHLDLRITFMPEDAAKAALFRTAVIRAEGNAGFNATFVGQKNGASDAGGAPDWLFAEAVLEGPAVPSGEPFALPLPLDSACPALLRRLRLADIRCGYRLVAVRSAGAPELAHRLAPALARCAVVGGAAAALLDPLQEAVRCTADTGWTVREGVCLPPDCTESAADLVETMLVNAVRERYPFLSDPLVGVAWARMDEVIDLQEDAGDHWQRAIERRREADYVMCVLSDTLGAAAGETRLAAGPVQPPSPSPSLSPSRASPTMPPPTGPFAFLSYAHRDRPAIDRLRASLTGHPLTIWFDDQIGSGAIWDELLEDRIRQCALLIACVSPAYEASRYCRREIKFADHLHKPILPVAIQDYMWGSGLALMFQELQILRLGDDDWGATLERHAEQLVSV